MRRSCSILVALLLTACTGAAGTAPTPDAESANQRRADPVDRRCAWPSEPAVIARHGSAALEMWELAASPVLDRPVVPDDPAYLRFRAAIRRAGADRVRPVADRPASSSDELREMWRREDRNAELVHGRVVGRLRPISCLEALVFAHQHRRHDEIAHPTEFLVSILRRRAGGQMRLRIYFTAGAEMFPPKQLYGFDLIERDRAAGWELLAVLHNHTVQQNGGRPALGQPVPSTSDVALLRGLAADLGMVEARVTNGFYTVDVPVAELDRLETRE